jgi:hypothetical protein
MGWSLNDNNNNDDDDNTNKDKTNPNPNPKVILEPAYERLKGFSWDGLEAFPRPRYYRVRVDLPPVTELKV